MTFFMMLVYLAYMARRSDTAHPYTWRFFLPNNPLASTGVSMRQLALFPLGSQLNAALSSPPSPFVAFPVQSVMTNMTIVYVALTSYHWLGTRYKQVHVVGIVLILVSVAIQLGPAVQANDCSATGLAKGDCFQSYKNTQGVYVLLSEGSMLLW